MIRPCPAPPWPPRLGIEVMRLHHYWQRHGRRRDRGFINDVARNEHDNEHCYNRQHRGRETSLLFFRFRFPAEHVAIVLAHSNGTSRFLTRISSTSTSLRITATLFAVSIANSRSHSSCWRKASANAIAVAACFSCVSAN